LGVRGAVDVVLQRLHTLPDRHIDEDAVVVERAQVRRVALRSLQAPDESAAAVGQRVDLLEARHESGHDRRVERRLPPSHVHLRDVMLPHGCGSYTRRRWYALPMRRATVILLVLTATSAMAATQVVVTRAPRGIMQPVNAAAEKDDFVIANGG